MWGTCWGNCRFSVVPGCLGSSSPRVWDTLPPGRLCSLPPRFWGSLPPGRLGSLPPRFWGSLPPGCLCSLSPRVCGSLPPGRLGSLSPQILELSPSLTPGFLVPESGFFPSRMPGFSPSHMPGFSLPQNLGVRFLPGLLLAGKPVTAVPEAQPTPGAAPGPAPWGTGRGQWGRQSSTPPEPQKPVLPPRSPRRPLLREAGTGVAGSSPRSHPPCPAPHSAPCWERLWLA
uniref:Uncharacterized protein n=1 Tax=Chrysemys picta bellii TaxID=8478 RepID=A0A8C3FN46_CHRPI